MSFAVPWLPASAGGQLEAECGRRHPLPLSPSPRTESVQSAYLVPAARCTTQQAAWPRLQERHLSPVRSDCNWPWPGRIHRPQNSAHDVEHREVGAGGEALWSQDASSAAAYSPIRKKKSQKSRLCRLERPFVVSVTYAIWRHCSSPPLDFKHQVTRRDKTHDPWHQLALPFPPSPLPAEHHAPGTSHTHTHAAHAPACASLINQFLCSKTIGYPV